VPDQTVKGEIIGVAQSLNKRKGEFTPGDLELRGDDDPGDRGAAGRRFIERMKTLRAQEMEFVEIVSEVTADIKLGSLLQRSWARPRAAQRRALDALPQRREDQRAVVGGRPGAAVDADPAAQPPRHRRRGLHLRQVRSTSLRLRRPALQPAFDKQTGFFTRSILCVPIVNKHGKTSASRRC
jgi:adenylate cyclase